MAKLQVIKNRLYLGGEELRGHIGFNSFHPFEQAYISSSTDWQTAIDTAATAGAKIIKIPLMPRYPTQLSTYVYTFSSPNYTLRASYIAKVNEILAYAETKGVSVLGVIIWRLATAFDIASESPNQVEKRGSGGREFCRQILAQMITEFGGNEMLAGWVTATEPDLSCYSGSVSFGISTANGTPASYTTPGDIMSLTGIVDFALEAANLIKATYPDAFVINGHIGPQVNASGIGWFANQPLTYAGMSAYSAHNYISSDVVDRTAEGVGLSGTMMFPDFKLPVVFDEFGAQITGGSTSLLDDATGDKAFTMYRKQREQGVALMLEWQLAKSVDDSFYGIWPGETRGTQRLSHVASINSSSGPGLAKCQLPSRPPYPTYAQFPGSATGFITVADNSVLKPSVFTVMGWFLPELGTSGTIRRVISKGSNAALGGFEVLLLTASTASDSKGIVSSIVTNNAGAAVRLEGDENKVVRGLGKWVHFAFSFDGTYMRRYYDGRQLGALPVAAYSYTPSTGSLYIGSDGSTLHFVGGISDVRMYSSVLGQDEIIKAGTGEFVGSPVFWMKLNGDANDYSGNGNHGSVGAAVTYRSTYTAKSTSAKSVIQRTVEDRYPTVKRPTTIL